MKPRLNRVTLQGCLAHVSSPDFGPAKSCDNTTRPGRTNQARWAKMTFAWPTAPSDNVNSCQDLVASRGPASVSASFKHPTRVPLSHEHQAIEGSRHREDGCIVFGGGIVPPRSNGIEAVRLRHPLCEYSAAGQ